MSSRPTPALIRSAVLVASRDGLAEAARQFKRSPSRICEWRKALEAETHVTFRRRYDLRRKRYKLTPQQMAELRERRSRGVSWGVLARIYKVSKTTCRRVAASYGGRGP